MCVSVSQRQPSCSAVWHSKRMNLPHQQKITVVGGGVMGEALIAGLLRSADPAPLVRVVEASPERSADLAQRYPLEVEVIDQAVQGADVVILAVKPVDMASALTSMAQHLAPGTLVISIAAGITIATLEGALGLEVDVVRAMPNTPARIDQGLIGISGAEGGAARALDETERLLSSVGVVVRIPEHLQDALTAVSGSGPAYVFYLAEKMIDAAVDLGLDPATARVMVHQTILGSAMLLTTSGEDAVDLRAKVTSKGGTTAAAIAELDRRGVGDAVGAAITAARDRGRELGKES
jgi:pyrroline-5-carboxylate reductase